MPTYRHLTSTLELTREWMTSELFPLCDKLREDKIPTSVLARRAIFCLFYEPSFLTRTSFERAVSLLGGMAHHTEDASQFFPVGIPNYIENIIHMMASLHVDLVVLRSSDHGVVERAKLTDAMPIINGGSRDDHPTQALADIYTLQREIGKVDGLNLAVVGRLEHRNVTALLKGLSLFKQIKVSLISVSGAIDPSLLAHCERSGMVLETEKSLDVLEEVDAIYLNGPRTVEHVRLLRSRNSLNLRLDEEFMARLMPHCVILDPMQRSGDFTIDVEDKRLVFYKQAENALFVRMAVLMQTLEDPHTLSY